MKKTIASILIVIVVVAVYIVFAKSGKLKSINFDDMFELEYSFELPDSLGPKPYVVAADFTEDGKIIFSEFRTLSIYILDIKTNQLKRIGRNGHGPGEYSMPLDLQVSGNQVNFVDEEKPFISTIDFKGQSIAETKIEFGSAGHSPFVEMNGIYYFLGTTYNSHFIRDQLNNKYNKIPRVFLDAPADDPPGIILDQGIIEYMNMFEAKIYQFNPNTLVTASIELNGFVKANWESHYDEKMTTLQVREYSHDLYKFLQFRKIAFNGYSKYFICALEPGIDLKETWNVPWSYYLVDNGGTVEAKISLESKTRHIIKQIRKDSALFFLSDENSGGFIKRYKIKQIK